MYAHKRHHPEHSGPAPSWTEQHSEQFTERNEPTKDFSGKSEDQEWVNTWLAKNKINHRLKEKKTEATMAVRVTIHLFQRILMLRIGNSGWPSY